MLDCTLVIGGGAGMVNRPLLGGVGVGMLNILLGARESRERMSEPGEKISLPVKEKVCACKSKGWRG
jgi:hypothetical protein